MLAVLIINYRTWQATAECLAAILAAGDAECVIRLLDNGSGEDDVTALRGIAAQAHGRIVMTCSTDNLGFAAGMNLLIDAALGDVAVDSVLLLNSDTRATPGCIAAMRAGLDHASNTDMVAARLLHADESVDSLGITLYRSHGEYFDAGFFCYAEDTDLAVRSRWLGYCVAYASDALVYHAGSLSSGGAGSDFVLYHGIRNSIWWLMKGAPTAWVVKSLPWLLVLHAGIVARHLKRGRARILWRLYRDAMAGWPAMRVKRARIRAARRVPAGTFAQWVEPRFYERNYVRQAWRELWQRQ